MTHIESHFNRLVQKNQGWSTLTALTATMQQRKEDRAEIEFWLPRLVDKKDHVGVKASMIVKSILDSIELQNPLCSVEPRNEGAKSQIASPRVLNQEVVQSSIEPLSENPRAS